MDGLIREAVAIVFLLVTEQLLGTPRDVAERMMVEW